MGNTRQSIIDMVKSGNLAALLDMEEEIKTLDSMQVPGQNGGKCIALPVMKSQQRTNKQVMGNQETMINLLLNGGGGNGGNGKDALRIPTPLGLISIPGERMRDAARLAAIALVAFLAWLVYDLKRDYAESQETIREEMRAIALPRVAMKRNPEDPQ